jgi:hypothetical protein
VIPVSKGFLDVHNWTSAVSGNINVTHAKFLLETILPIPRWLNSEQNACHNTLVTVAELRL